MKIIFLDVDGVLNMWGSGGLLTLNKKRLSRLNKIIEATGAHIVLSSSWRKLDGYIPHVGYPLKKLEKALGYYGHKIHSMTTTVYFKERQIRGDEIAEWLNRHPEVTNFVILDDDSDMLITQREHFVHTDGKKGLTDEDVEKAIRILNK